MSLLLGALDPIAISFGGIEIHWYGVIIASAVILATILAVREARRRRINPDDIYDMILWALPVAIISARTYYVAFQWQYYSQHPDQIVRIWDGGIAIYGALIGAGIVVYFFTRSRWIPTWLMLDVAAPVLIMAQGIGRWGNFMNQEAYGKAVKSLNYLPDFIKNQMYIDGSYRVPTFLYESMWNLLGFIIIMSVRHRPRFLKQGEVTFFYLIWYGCGRFVIEGMRTDSLMFLGMRVSQWLSAVLILLGIVLIVWRRNQKDIPYYQE